MFITQIRKLALFEFIDTKPIVSKVKETLGLPTGDCEEDDEDCEEAEAEARRRLQDEEDEEDGEEGEDGETAEEDNSDLSRLGSADILDNLGIMLIFTILLVAVVVLLIVAACILRKNKKAQELFKKIKEKLFWNTFIRFVVQSTLAMQLSAGAAIVLTLSGEQLDTRKNAKTAD